MINQAIPLCLSYRLDCFTHDLFYGLVTPARMLGLSVAFLTMMFQRRILMKTFWVNPLLVVAILSVPTIAAGQVENRENALATEESHVLGTVQKLFDAMAARDTVAAALAVIDDVSLVSTAETVDGPVVNKMDRATFFASIASPSNSMLERMWDATVRVHGGIATVWTPYDFHRNGEFSHCGIDAANLVRTKDGWRIASLVWTAEPTGCSPSPLGPPPN